MPSRDRVDSFLKELGKSTGLDLFLDHNGKCALRYGGVINCTIEVSEEREELNLSASVADLMYVEKELQSVFFEEMLTWNLLCRKTRGATLAIDRRGRQIVLCFVYSIDSLDDTGFENILGNFLDTAKEIKVQIDFFLQGNKTHRCNSYSSSNEQNPHKRIRIIIPPKSPFPVYQYHHICNTPQQKSE